MCIRCSVPGCENSDVDKIEGISFHCFPSDRCDRQIWLETFDLDDRILSECSVICSQHFHPSDFITTGNECRVLKRNAMPVSANINQNKDTMSILTNLTCNSCIKFKAERDYLFQKLEEFTKTGKDGSNCTVNCPHRELFADAVKEIGILKSRIVEEGSEEIEGTSYEDVSVKEEHSEEVTESSEEVEDEDDDEYVLPDVESGEVTENEEGTRNNALTEQGNSASEEPHSNTEEGSVTSSCIQKRKKRKRNEMSWKHVVRKKLRDSGKVYIATNGIICPGRKPPTEGRICKCRNRGCKTLVIEQKMKCFDEFYSKTYEEQCFLLYSCMQYKNVMRRTFTRPLPVSEEENGHTADLKRQASFSYHLPINGKKVKVCKSTLCNVFSVTGRRLQVLQEKLKKGISKPTDLRGKHSNRPHKIPGERKEWVRQHIASFPTEECHYFPSSRTTGSVHYLHSGLSMATMHRLFKEKFPELPVKNWMYKSVFKTDFNLIFGQPRSETCTTCDKLYNKLIAADDARAAQILEESTVHHRNAEEGYSILNEDVRESMLREDMVTLLLDIQKVVYLPMSTDSEAFYLRKLSCYNVAICRPSSNDITMHIWDESIAGRGTWDIASCVLRYVTTKYRKLRDGEERKLVIWSDRHVAQNSNRDMVALLVYLVKLRYFTAVEQKFLVDGHSFLPCDRDFAVLERSLNSAKVMVPWQMEAAVLSARPSDPFQVSFMRQSDFKDFTVLEQTMDFVPKGLTENATCLRVGGTDTVKVEVRYNSHSVLSPWKTYQIDGRTTMFGLEETLPCAYNGPRQLKPEKLRDLRRMCEFIHPNYRDFYLSLT